jgi:hypothetical protein
MLDMVDCVPKIHFSEELMTALGEEKRWIWYLSGEDNPGASVTSPKFPPPVMIFAVSGIGFKLDCLLGEGSIDSDRYLQNLDRLGVPRCDGCQAWPVD